MSNHYRVWLKVTTDMYVDVIAPDRDMAHAIGERFLSDTIDDWDKAKMGEGQTMSTFWLTPEWEIEVDLHDELDEVQEWALTLDYLTGGTA
jgi:hypothetical protein